MVKTYRILIVIALVLSLVPAANTTIAAETAIHPDAVLCTQLGGVFSMDSDGATICYWVPTLWNMDLVVFAHGYVEPRLPVGIPWNQLLLPDGTSLPGIINKLGFAFAVTSYSKNGLAVTEGVQGVFNLVSIFKEANPTARRVFLVGASEGGLVTTLALEKDAQMPTHVFSGGMSTCGPVGDFVKQMNYWGDFRLIFDHYFPGVIPVPPGVTNPVINIAPDVIEAWSTLQLLPQPHIQPGLLQAAVLEALQSDPVAALKLIKVTKASFDLANLQKTIGETTLGILGYNITSTNEGRQELHGGPVDLNSNTGSPYSNINRKFYDPNGTPIEVTTYEPDPLALEEIYTYYTTTGMIKAPLVGMHTTGDPIVPYWHELLYRMKTLQAGTAWEFINIPIYRYGHCNFKASEAIFGFVVMVIRATSSISILQDVDAALPDVASQQEFQVLKDANPELFTFETKIFIPFIRR